MSNLVIEYFYLSTNNVFGSPDFLLVLPEWNSLAWAGSNLCTGYILTVLIINHHSTIEPMSLAYLNMTNFTFNSKRIHFGESETRCITFNIIPSNRTDVDYFSITNSQNNEVKKVGPTESNVTLCLEPGMVTFNITTEYRCPFTSDPRIITKEIPRECFKWDDFPFGVWRNFSACMIYWPCLLVGTCVYYSEYRHYLIPWDYTPSNSQRVGPVKNNPHFYLKLIVLKLQYKLKPSGCYKP